MSFFAARFLGRADMQRKATNAWLLSHFNFDFECGKDKSVPSERCTSVDAKFFLASRPETAAAAALGRATA